MSKPRMLAWKGQTKSLNEWARLTGLHPETIRSRIDHQGYTVDEALSRPIGKKFDPRTKSAVPAPRPCPQMREHAGSGQAYVRWRARGKDTCRYLGEWGSKDAAAAYRRFAMEWATAGADGVEEPGEQLHVCELAERYLEHVDRYYVKDGKRTSEVHGQRAAIRVLTELYPLVPVGEFKARNLKVCQTAMVRKGWARGTINQHTWRIVRCFQWGVGEDLVPPDVYAKLAEVPNLQPGRSEAIDAEPILSVPADVIEKTVPHLHRDAERRVVLEAMIRFQLYTGCRPGELCRMTVGDIDRSDTVWRFLSRSHKNLHRQARRKPRVVWIGPQAREILTPFLADPGPDGRVWTFPPRGQQGTKRTAITRVAYGEFVRKACERAGVDGWTPHQLRHNRATEVQRIYESNEHAARAIGDTPEVTANVYVDPGEAVARRIAEATG